jgi:RHS repeat-associated protein
VKNTIKRDKNIVENTRFSHWVGIRNISDYSPFGVLLPERTVENKFYRYGYQGSESDDEVKGAKNSYTTEYRQLDPRIGRWLSIDPVIQPWQSPYCSMDNNPIWLNDVKGDKGESTHIDEKGKVIAVFNDGDNGIYQHGQNADGGTPTKYMITKRHEKWGKAAHGKKVGETKYWDEFLVPKQDESTPSEIYPNTRIMLGTDWKPLVEWANDYATNNWDLTVTMERSKLGQVMDIKNNKDIIIKDLKNKKIDVQKYQYLNINILRKYARASTPDFLNKYDPYTLLKSHLYINIRL